MCCAASCDGEKDSPGSSVQCPESGSSRVDRAPRWAISIVGDEKDDLFFGSGWHACFGQAVGREQIIEKVRHLLRLPNLRRAPGMIGNLEYEYFSPKKLVIEFGPNPVQGALTAVMTIKPPEELNYRALKRLLSRAYGSVEQLLNRGGTVHFARFVFLENNTKLALITSFAGDFDTSLEVYNTSLFCGCPFGGFS